MRCGTAASSSVLPMLLALGVAVQIGCAPLRAILAPESVLAQAGAQVGASANQVIDEVATAQAVQDVDRILATRSDAVNIEELRRLKADLEANPLTTRPPPRAPSEPPPRDFDRRQASTVAATPTLIRPGQVHLPGSSPSRGHRLQPQPVIGVTHRGEGEPFAASPGHLVPAATPKHFALDYQQVRDSGSGVESRR